MKASNTNAQSRRAFLQDGISLTAVAATQAGATAPAAPDTVSKTTFPAFELRDASIPDLQQAMASGKWSAEQITTMYLKRIDQMDKRGPAVNAIIELNPDALAIAKTLDAERESGHVRGSMHGIPVLIKDNIDTAGRMATSVGSLALQDSHPKADSMVVKRLREAGAIILGKTNLSEWANLRSPHSTSGWSSRGGLTRNPYALDRNPCGSSSGSAVAVASEFAPVAVGTETDGSVVCPSTFCSLVGFKPTVGVVSRTGLVPISHTQDTAGPMGKTVLDVAILLDAMAGADPADSTTQAAPQNSASGFADGLREPNPKGMRVGIARSMFAGDARILPLMDEAIATLKDAGFTIIDPVDLSPHEDLNASEFQVLGYEFRDGLNRYLGNLGGAITNLEDVIDFNRESRATVMPYFGQEHLEAAAGKGSLTDQVYLEALRTCGQLSRTEGIDRALAESRLDAVVCVTGGLPWVTDLINGDNSASFRDSYSATLPAVAGYPHVTVPMGYVFGLPAGISFFGGAFSDKKILQIAHAYEQASRKRRPPQFLSTANLGVFQ